MLTMIFLLVLLMEGCSSAKDNGPAVPFEITSETVCALDGMFLSEHSGPKAQILYKDAEDAEFLCNIPELFAVYKEPGTSVRIRAMIVQDTADVDWDDPKGHWIKAEEAVYVKDSSRKGAMGLTYAPFSDRTKAQKFQGKYGGEILTFEELARVP